jgi:transposase
LSSFCELTGQPEELTLVFDAGASSRQNLEGLERYVTAVRPSYYHALLSEAAEHLAEVQLSNGAAVRAWRTPRTVAGKQRDVVVVFSPQLQEGQLRGLRQTLSRCRRELEEMQLHPPASAEAVKRKLDRIRGHQYIRSLLCCEIDRDGQGAVRIPLWSDWQEYQRLITRYFGLRIQITDRAEWSTAQIIAAYHGQSKVEAVFRDLKDPRMLSTRPQFH